MSQSCPVTQVINTFYQNFTHPTLWVGFSGGMDSSVLVHALARTKPAECTLKALHIHHGLQPAADQWMDHCREVASELNIEFTAKRVIVDLTENREAAARKARYQAFSQLLAAGESIATAHHQRDQAETFLLNLMRGAGIAGLSAMPDKRRLNAQVEPSSWLVRPLLNLSYQDLLNYAQTHQLSWVEDPMNQQLQYRRNMIRHQILPQCHQAWAQPEKKIAQAAAHCTEANYLLEQLAELDLDTIPHGSGYLDWQAIQKFDWPRQKNLLRHWFYQYHQYRLNQADLDWLKNECFTAVGDASPQRTMQGKSLRRYLSFIHYPVELEHEFSINWNQDLSLESIDTALQPCWGQGVAQHWFEPENEIQIRSLQPSDSVKRSSLKKWFQKNQIPPWQRTHWPVLIVNGQLAAIRDYRVFPAFIAKSSEMGVKFMALN